jgi:hypothetical protein
VRGWTVEVEISEIKQELEVDEKMRSESEKGSIE